MLVFETMYRKKKRFASNIGSRVKDVFSSKFDKDGKLVVYKSGEENLYAQIQTHADSVNLELIVERFRNGDQNALTQKVGSFFDATGIPSSLIDYYNLLREGERSFMAMPAEVRERYHHNFAEFLSDYDPAHFAVADGESGSSSGVEGGDPDEPPTKKED